MTVKVPLGLDWAFENCLEPEKEHLRQALKPAVIKWSAAKWPVLRENLKGDPKAGCSTATDMLNETVDGRTVWVFVSMFVNRDIGDDVTAMVASSERVANIMADSMFKAMEIKLGNPTKVFY